MNPEQIINGIQKMMDKPGNRFEKKSPLLM
jgi:hypothetical protein